MIGKDLQVLRDMTNIAVIGSGISGLSASYILSKQEKINIDLYEKESRLGGHTHTHELNLYGDTIRVDSGFIVFNQHNYPNLLKLFKELNVEINDSSMSFSYNSISSAWSSEDYKKLSSIANKSYLRRLIEIIRFKRLALITKDEPSNSTLGSWLIDHNFSNEFTQEYVVPMAASIWSSNFDVIREFPFKTFVEFYDNHQLFNLLKRPQWKSVNNGSSTYIEKMQTQWGVKNIFLNAKLEINFQDKFFILNNGIEKSYDMVIFACHANQIKTIFPKIDTFLGTSLLNEFSYSQNLVSIHTDESVMPLNKNQWSSWNIQQLNQKFFLTYWMNNLQKLDTNHNIFVSVGDNARISREKLINSFTYQHPIYNSKSVMAQNAITKFQGNNGIYLVGAYLGYGFHEDGLNSAIKVAQTITKDLNVF
ncbi:MAG: NAD(P)/FAD-dependent oxidoreductase [Gammaproteobacteria bacterium]|jgi:predicted NAD/FAD-binding protein